MMLVLIILLMTGFLMLNKVKDDDSRCADDESGDDGGDGGDGSVKII